MGQRPERPEVGSMTYVFALIALLYAARLSATVFLAGKGAYHVRVGREFPVMLDEARRLEERENLLALGQNSTQEKSGILDNMAALAGLRKNVTDADASKRLEQRMEDYSGMVSQLNEDISASISGERLLGTALNDASSAPAEDATVVRRYGLLHGGIVLALVVLLLAHALV